MNNNLHIEYDEASGHWTGRPWLVIASEDEPAVARCRTEADAQRIIDLDRDEGVLDACVDRLLPLVVAKAVPDEGSDADASKDLERPDRWDGGE
jgi:hypothetical protein